MRHRWKLSAVLICLFLLANICAQVPATAKRYIRIGYLHSKFSAYGAERAWNGQDYEGMAWPADYLDQDCAVIEMSTLAVKNFIDEYGRQWESFGIQLSEGYVAATAAAPGVCLFPIELKQTAKFKPPAVYVDGNDVTALFAGDVDEIDPDQIPDRIVNNVVNTTMGLTITRKILAFSQQYHNNYFIKEYTFANTGNTDYDEDIELNAPLNGLRIGWGVRYSVCRDGAYHFDTQQLYGKYSWVSKRGEDYAQHIGETITEDNPIVDWLRCGYSWTGQSSKNAYDNIGAPDLTGNGRLTAPQFAGSVILHVDRSATDNSDDPDQPAVLGWHAGDEHRARLGDLTDVGPMNSLYRMLSGNPYNGLGDPAERFYEVNCPTITSPVDPSSIHSDPGGTHVWICYGPFDLNPGESIHIVEAEAVSGLSRAMSEEIGARWKEAYDDPSDNGPFTLPDGGTTDDKDIYKNSWFYTGRDSLFETFGRAKRNFNSNYQIPRAPEPPPIVEINSGGDRINISWVASPSETEPGFGGYRIYRAVGKQDTTYQVIFACGAGTDHPEIINTYEDRSPVRGFAYYYYVVAFNDGGNNITGITNPTGSLESSRFYTQSTEPAFLQRQAGESLEAIRVVPNPFNIRARDINYPNEERKIAFLNIPAFCQIKIYTERGDLIATIDHTNGSGDEYWNTITSARQQIVSGIYIAYFKVTRDYRDPFSGQLLYRKGDNTYRKFAVVR